MAAWISVPGVGPEREGGVRAGVLPRRGVAGRGRRLRCSRREEIRAEGGR